MTYNNLSIWYHPKQSLLNHESLENRNQLFCLQISARVGLLNIILSYLPGYVCLSLYFCIVAKT